MIGNKRAPTRVHWIVYIRIALVYSRYLVRD